MSKIVVIMGAPGAGKGTQARLLQERLGLPQISTGDMFRELAKAETPLAAEVREVQAAGRLISDELVIRIVRERTSEDDCRDGYILDGFPRTVAQAEALERMLAEKGMKLDAVVELRVDDRILLDRIRTRVAASGGAVRADDTPEALERRLQVYHAQTAPLIAFYRDKGLLRTVDGMAPIDEVAREIERALRPAAAGGC